MSTDTIKDHGLIIRWNRSYGFIRPSGAGAGDKDIYVNVKNAKDELANGVRVSYHLSPDARHPGRLQAVDVEIVR
jgi:cold shock CspA family protein